MPDEIAKAIAEELWSAAESRAPIAPIKALLAAGAYGAAGRAEPPRFTANLATARRR